MSPEPLAVQVPPPVPTHVQLAPRMAEGTVSVTVAPLAACGPPFPTAIVYVMGRPATAVVWPSVLVTPRSAWGAMKS